MFDDSGYDPAAKTNAPSPIDVAISFPASGLIRVQSQALFAEPDNDQCRRFLQRVFAAEPLSGAKLNGVVTPMAELRFDNRRYTLRDVLDRLAKCLTAAESPVADSQSDASQSLAPVVAPPMTARDRHGVVQYHRYGHVVTGFQIVGERTGFMKVKNPVLYRKNGLCQAIERELMSVLGVDRYTTHSLQCTVQVEYDPRRLTRHQIIEILDGALANAEHQAELDKLDLDLAICTGSLVLAGVAQFAAPALLPVAAAVFA
ncbi:MAG TPA: hypothetical protein VLU73_00430, partial [Methylococcaceae bacterium]|nr:hypothetical protein [Methylococcaceae bacterium]